jgi:hypothetical protein
MYNQNAPAATVVNCSFIGNSSGLDGGAVENDRCSSALVGCSFFGNSANGVGGAMDNYGNSNVIVTNCTFALNSGVGSGGGMNSVSGSTPTIRNCIFWGNTQQTAGTVADAQIFLNGVSATVTYSCIQDDAPGDGSIPFGGAANHNTDRHPLFVSTEYGDLRLRPGSPCIDAGNNAVVPADTADLDGDANTTEPLPLDLAGIPRFVDDPATINTGSGTPPIVDMGAYEGPHVFCDVNDDGGVDVVDLLYFVDAFGAVRGDAVYDARCDFNKDDGVDVVDLLIFVDNFGL